MKKILLLLSLVAFFIVSCGSGSGDNELILNLKEEEVMQITTKNAKKIFMKFNT